MGIWSPGWTPLDSTWPMPEWVEYNVPITPIHPSIGCAARQGITIYSITKVIRDVTGTSTFLPVPRPSHVAPCIDRYNPTQLKTGQIKSDQILNPKLGAIEPRMGNDVFIRHLWIRPYGYTSRPPRGHRGGDRRMPVINLILPGPGLTKPEVKIPNPARSGPKYVNNAF